MWPLLMRLLYLQRWHLSTNICQSAIRWFKVQGAALVWSDESVLLSEPKARNLCLYSCFPDLKLRQGICSACIKLVSRPLRSSPDPDLGRNSSHIASPAIKRRQFATPNKRAFNVIKRFCNRSISSEGFDAEPPRITLSMTTTVLPVSLSKQLN